MDFSVLMVLRQLLTQAPMLIAYTVGIVMAIVNWRRYPRPCLFTLIASGVSLFMAILYPILHFVLFQAMSRLGWTASLYGYIFSAIGIVGGLIHAAAYGLLLMAVFADRAARQPDQRMD